MHCCLKSRQDHPNPQRRLQAHSKGDGPLSHHLLADYTRDKDKTLVCQPKKYIDRLVDSCHSMFKQDPPKNMRTPLDKNDHPELDDTELLTGEPIQHYLTMVGQLVRRRRSNPGGHTDGLVVFACSSDASEGQSS